jgi:ClpP class serine protease
MTTQTKVLSPSIISAAVNKVGWHITENSFLMMESHVTGQPLSLTVSDDDEDKPNYDVTVNGVAVISVRGTLIDAEPSWWLRYLGYASTPQLARDIRQATADPSVRKIVLWIVSGGGMVSGMCAACDAVYECRGVKPIWAACSFVCSAAYELASQCDKVYLTEEGMAGGLGTYIAVTDMSKYYADAGISRYIIASDGAETYKGSGERGVKISAAQKADMKRIVNEYRQVFNGIIQRGRGFTDEQIKALTDGRPHIGRNALALKLVDGIASSDLVISAISNDVNIDEPAPPSDDDEAMDLFAAAKGGGEDTVNMALKDLVAAMLGRAKSDDEKAVAAQLETELAAKEAKEAENETLRAELAEAKAAAANAGASLVNTEATSYALGLCASGKLTAAEANDVIENYMQAQADDAKDGGKRLDKLKGFLDKRPVTGLQSAVIEAAASSTDTDTEKTLKVLLSREATPENTNRGDHQGLDKADSEGVHLTHKSMSTADREAAVKRAKAQAGSN